MARTANRGVIGAVLAALLDGSNRSAANPATRTALGTMLLAAIEDHFPPERGLLRDALAESTLPPGMRMVARATQAAWLRERLVRRLEREHPGTWAGIACHKRCIDGLLAADEQAAADGPLDPRAHAAPEPGVDGVVLVEVVAMGLGVVGASTAPPRGRLPEPRPTGRTRRPSAGPTPPTERDQQRREHGRRGGPTRAAPATTAVVLASVARGPARARCPARLAGIARGPALAAAGRRSARANGERDRNASLLHAANASLTQACIERDSFRGDLNRVSGAHAETRKLLQSAESKGLGLIQERDRLRADAESAQRARQALVDICRWLDIDPSEHIETSAKLGAIFTAIERQEKNHREFVHRTERHLCGPWLPTEISRRRHGFSR